MPATISAKDLQDFVIDVYKVHIHPEVGGLVLTAEGEDDEPLDDYPLSADVDPDVVAGRILQRAESDGLACGRPSKTYVVRAIKDGEVKVMRKLRFAVVREDAHDVDFSGDMPPPDARRSRLDPDDISLVDRLTRHVENLHKIDIAKQTPLQETTLLMMRELRAELAEHRALQVHNVQMARSMASSEQDAQHRREIEKQDHERSALFMSRIMDVGHKITSHVLEMKRMQAEMEAMNKREGDGS